VPEIDAWCNNLLQWLMHRGRGQFKHVSGDDRAGAVGYGRLLRAGLLDDLVAELDRRARDRADAEGTVELVMALGAELHYPRVPVRRLKPPTIEMLQLWGPQSNVLISPSFLLEEGGPGEGQAEWERWRRSGRAREDAQDVLDAIQRKWPDAHVEWPPTEALRGEEQPQPKREPGRPRLEDDRGKVADMLTRAGKADELHAATGASFEQIAGMDGVELKPRELRYWRLIRRRSRGDIDEACQILRDERLRRTARPKAAENVAKQQP
jgi:hypothetical protein